MGGGERVQMQMIEYNSVFLKIHIIFMILTLNLQFLIFLWLEINSQIKMKSNNFFFLLSYTKTKKHM